MRKFVLLLTIFSQVFVAPLFAQDFGFGFSGDDEADFVSPAGSGLPVVEIGGEVSASIIGYGEDFANGASNVKFGDIFSGKLNFSISSSIADGIIKLKLYPDMNPVSVADVIDEGYVRLYFGNVDIEGGYRKLTWGKADSFGPLDVVNPIDSSKVFTEMADNTDLMGVKITRPMLHVS
ncbi:MAG: hypothetical protein LBB47_03605, partial [Spirochaetaceae bacterium]|nr:hypothetical protein [Spirochaetaceae bacterium]